MPPSALSLPDEVALRILSGCPMVDISAGVPGLIALPHLQSMTVAGPFVVSGLAENLAMMCASFTRDQWKQRNIGAPRSAEGKSRRSLFFFEAVYAFFAAAR